MSRRDHCAPGARGAGITPEAGEDIRPFRIDVPESDVDDLRARLDRTRWPDELRGRSSPTRSTGRTSISPISGLLNGTPLR